MHPRSLLSLLAITFSLRAFALDFNGMWEVGFDMPPGPDDAAQEACFQVPVEDEGDRVRFALPYGGQLEGIEKHSELRLTYTPVGGGKAGTATLRLVGSEDKLEGSFEAHGETVRAWARRVSKEKRYGGSTECDGKPDGDEKAPPPVDRNKPLQGISPTAICKMFGGDWIAAKVAQSYTKKLFSPMSACSPSKKGAGFFLMGNEGPGQRPYASSTVYLGTHGSHFCKSSKYPFVLRSGKTTSAVSNFDKHAEQVAPFLGMQRDLAIKALAELRRTIGDFAVSQIYNPDSKKYSLYINVLNDSVCRSEGVTRLKESLSKGLGELAVPGVMKLHATFCGTNIRDAWNIKATPLPIPTCNRPLLISYLFGTIQVIYDR